MAPGSRLSIGSRIAFVHTDLQSKGEAWHKTTKTNVSFSVALPAESTARLPATGYGTDTRFGVQRLQHRRCRIFSACGRENTLQPRCQLQYGLATTDRGRDGCPNRSSNPSDTYPHLRQCGNLFSRNTAAVKNYNRVHHSQVCNGDGLQFALTFRKTRRPNKSSMLPFPIGVPLTHHLPNVVNTQKGSRGWK